MKEIEVTASQGDHADICATCKKIIGDVTLYLPVKYDFFTTIHEETRIAGRDTRYFKIAKIPFKPTETCQCEEQQA